MSTGQARRAAVADAGRRATARQREHLARLARALRHGGPGRLPGGVARAVSHADHVAVEGWAGGGSRLVAILVTVDGEAVAAAELGRPIPSDDGGTTYSTRAGDQGWRASLPRTAIGPGEHVLGALAVLAGGLTEQLLPLRASIAEPDVGPGTLDVPAAGATLAGPLALVSGWARVDGGCDVVEVRLGDAPPRRARLLCVPRPDVAALVPEPSAPLAGWQVLLDVPEVERATPATLTARARGPAGAVELGRRDVLLAPPEPPPEPDAPRLAQLAARTAAVARRHRPRADGLHLLVATHHLGLGGGQLYLHELLRRLLASEDVSCTVLAPDDGPLRAELERWGARVHTVGATPAAGLAYEARMLELCQLAGSTGARVVLANTTGAFWGVDLAHRCGLPAIWAIHESFTLEQFLAVGFPTPLDAAVARRVREAFHTAEVVAFEADATRTLLAPLGAADRFVRIDYGVDVDRIDEYAATHDRHHLRASLGFAPSDTVLLCLGTYEPRKAQGLLALAFAAVATAHPDACLALVGDTATPFAEAVHELVGRMPSRVRIRLVPVTADIDGWYRAADAFVLASDVESLPRSMLEAMAHGTPVLASAVFGVPELLDDGDTGILFEPLSMEALRTALLRFLALSQDERRAMGERGRGLVAEQRRSDAYAGTYRALLDALAADRTVPPRAVLPLLP